MHNSIASTAAKFQPPPGAQTICTLDMHTGGEPLRIVTGGLPHLPGRTVLEKRAWFRAHFDSIRTALMWEPRGHADMYGAVVTPSSETRGAFDVFFLHNEGYSTMCGHAILALTKYVAEAGLVPVSGGKAHAVFHVPAGRIDATAFCENGVVQHSVFRNVPSFVLRRNAVVDVPGLGAVTLDVAYGGAFYALVDSSCHGLTIDPANAATFVDLGRRIKSSVARALSIDHPFEPELSFLYGVIFTGPPVMPGHHSRNVCVFADGEIDRSATGSGVSARAALHVARAELALGEPAVIESIAGSTMRVTAVEQVMFGPYSAIIPEVGGSAHYTGRHEFWIDPSDPMRKGFLVR